MLFSSESEALLREDLDMIVKAKQFRLPQIKWESPSKFVLASNWYVVSSEDSEEKAVQKLRESTVLEALYHRSSTIPDNPLFPPDIENKHHDDRQTPLIPIIPIEEAEGDDASLALSLPVSKPSIFLSLKEDNGGHDHAGNAHVAATKSLLAPVHTTNDYNAKSAVPMLKDHEQSAQRIIHGNLQKPEFSKKRYKKACCKFVNTPKGCKYGSKCRYSHEMSNQQRPNKRMKLDSDDFPAGGESSLHSSFDISTEINKLSGLGVSVKDGSKHDLQTPLIPILPIEEAKHDAASLAAVVAVTAIMRSMDPKSLIDANSLTNIPSNPTMTLATDNISIPSESNMPINAQLSLPRMPAGDALSLPVSEANMFLSLKEDHGGHVHAGNAHVAATESLLAPVHITKYSNAKTAVPMLKDHEQSPHKSIRGNLQKPAFSNRRHQKDCKSKDHEQSPQRNIHGNLQKPAFSNRKHQKACIFIHKPEGCKYGSRCLYRHETYTWKRPNKRRKLGSDDFPANEESSLHSSYHTSTDASCKINKPCGWRMIVQDDDFPADDDDESSLHSSSYHTSTDASCKINKPYGWRMIVQDDDFPAADDDDESSLHSSSYHISTDASWKINRPSGLGVSIMDGNGHLLEAWCDSKRDLPSSTVAEGFALRWALSESLQRNWDNIHIFSDCKTLVDCINGATRCPSSCRVVYDDIILLKSNFRSCVVSFVPRSRNVHADKLANIGTSLTKKVCVKVLSHDGITS